MKYRASFSLQGINGCAIIVKNTEEEGPMNILFGVLYALTGLIIGYYIPCFSFMVMEYKKGKGNVIKKYELLYSKLFRFMLCVFNGVFWYLASMKMDIIFSAILVGIMISLGLIIAFIDINIRIIPNELVLIMMVVGLIFQVSTYGFKSLIPSLISMVVMMTVFISVAGFVGFGKVGAGDVKLAAAMGLSLGYPTITIAVIIMAVVLIIFIAAGLLFKKIYMTTMLPLAPFMIAGYIGSLLLSLRIF